MYLCYSLSSVKSRETEEGKEIPLILLSGDFLVLLIVLRLNEPYSFLTLGF